MAQNDMEVIMYKILRYLYECMKTGKRPELTEYSWESKLICIPKEYCFYRGRKTGKDKTVHER